MTTKAKTLAPELLRRRDAYWRAACVKQAIRDKLIEHKQYIAEHDEGLPEIGNWKWSLSKPRNRKPISTGRG